MSHKRNLRITVALSVAALAASLAPSAQAATFCNEVGNGHRGTYVVMGTPDPSIPARHKDGLAVLGKGKGIGLERAATRAPALSECGLPTSGDGGDATVVTSSPGEGS